MKVKTVTQGDLELPRVITHKNAGPIREVLRHEPEFNIACKNYTPTGDEWYRMEVYLEVPAGELAKDALATVALIGGRRNPRAYESMDIKGDEQFNAQGLEGKVRIRKDLFAALINLDIIPEYRGRIVVP